MLKRGDIQGALLALFLAALGALALGGLFVSEHARAQSAPSATNFTGNPWSQRGQHMVAGGNQQTIGSGCGTGAVTFGTDTAGKVMMGTGSSSCVITWAQAWVTPPTCIVSGENAVPSYSLAPSPLTALTISNPVDGQVYQWHCFARPN